MTIEARLARLERETRWTRRGIAVLVAVAAFVVLSAQGKENELPELEVRSLTLKDDSGQSRAALRMKDGSACLSLRDVTGADRLVLTSEKNCGLQLIDEGGTLRCFLTLDIKGEPSLVLSDSKGVFNVLLQSMAGGYPLLRMLDGDKRLRVALGIDPRDIFTTLVLQDVDGKTIWESSK